MNNLEKYLDGVITEKSAGPDAPKDPSGPPPKVAEVPEPDVPTGIDTVKGILRRWYLLLGVSLLICLPSVPAIWFLIEPVYYVTGTIRIAPILSNLLTGDDDTGGISNYQTFMNTEARMIVSSRVIEGVADDLADKGLEFFEEKPHFIVAELYRRFNIIQPTSEPAAILKEAVLDGTISAAPARGTEELLVTMAHTNAEEARSIVNSFINYYKVVQGTDADKDENSEIQTLQDRRKELDTKMQTQRQTIQGLAAQHGSTNLNDRHAMQLQRVGNLLAELTRLEVRRMNLEIRVKVISESNSTPVDEAELLTMRQQYVNNDPTAVLLTSSIAQLEQSLIESQERYIETHPEIERQTRLLATMKARIEDRKAEAGKTFDDLMAERKAENIDRELLLARNELDQVKENEQQIREILQNADKETVEIGKTQLTIQQTEQEYALTKDIYDAVLRRIEVLELEQQRPRRVSISNAQISQIRDKRAKYTVALVFGSMVLGSFLAFMKDKADHSLRTPDEIAKRVGLQIIGTTTSPQMVNKARLQEHFTGDYQTIRANLGILHGTGLPRRLVVASPGMREGKTTFAINLATSIASSGKSVLLIDGDLRKPDVAPLLNIPVEARGLQDVLMGRVRRGVIYSVPSSRLDVLAASTETPGDVFELISSPRTAQRIEAISRKYDHVIIDTPPILAFSDALVWAKMAGAVVLTTFAGQTKAPELKEAKKRLTQIDVKVLGTVLGNVDPSHGYFRYAQGYYNQARRSSRRTRRRMLLAAY